MSAIQQVNQYNTYLFYFQQLGKCYPYQVDDSDIDIKIGDFVILDTEKGIEYSITKKVYLDHKKRSSFYIKNFIRKANNEDMETIKKIEALEKEAYHLCKSKGYELNLQMKLIKVKYLFDFSKVIFYFTANGRIDFRELVKQLAYKLKTRIEMRQIGIRDEAKILGGLGICGQHTCCNLFMSRFDPVSLKMARDQNLSCNPSRISGVCGRLMCCMFYEYSTYIDIKKGFPRVGYKIHHDDGIAEVTAVNYISKQVWVRFSKDGKEITMDLDSIKELEWEFTEEEQDDTCEEEETAFADDIPYPSGHHPAAEARMPEDSAVSDTGKNGSPGDSNGVRRPGNFQGNEGKKQVFYGKTAKKITDRNYKKKHSGSSKRKNY